MLNRLWNYVNDKSQDQVNIFKEYYDRKSFILLAGTGVMKISSSACGFNPTKIFFMIIRKIYQ